MTSFNPSHLSFRVESLVGSLPVESFLRIAREIAFVAAETGGTFARASEPAGSGPGSEVGHGWAIVDIQLESPDKVSSDEPGRQRQHGVFLRLAPPVGKEEVAVLLREAVRAIGSGCVERPNGLSDGALRSLRRVASSAGRRIRVSFSAGQGEGEALYLDESFARQIDGWLNGQSSSMGTVEGRLELISIHDRLRFTLYGRDSSRIECNFPEAMLDDVKAALGERVCLRGRIKYRRDGKPATVDAGFLQTLKPSRVNSVQANF